MLIIDSHEDLATNMLSYQRDYRRSALETRRLEQGKIDLDDPGECTLGWPEYQQGQVALIFSTLFVAPDRYEEGGIKKQAYRDFPAAAKLYRAQVDIYQRVTDESPHQFRLVRNQRDLAVILNAWDKTPAEFPRVTNPVGLILLIEGLEGIRDAKELEEFWEHGVRMAGMVWAGTRLCGGAFVPDGKGFSQEGLEFMKVMSELGMSLDLAHMNDQSALEALDRYQGAVLASHVNARALIKGYSGERHFTDEVIRGLIDRDGVMGLVPFNHFLDYEWTHATGKQAITLDHLVKQVDYICQMAGNARHVAIGTDFDGGYGANAIPAEIDTIADFQKLVPVLKSRGYAEDDIASIMGNNWRRFVERTLPA